MVRTEYDHRTALYPYGLYKPNNYKSGNFGDHFWCICIKKGLTK